MNPAIGVYFDYENIKKYNSSDKNQSISLDYCINYIKYIYSKKDLFYIYFNNDEDISFCELFINKLDKATFSFLNEKNLLDKKLNGNIYTMRSFCRYCNTSNVYTLKYNLLQNQSIEEKDVIELYKDLNGTLALHISKKFADNSKK